MYKLFCVKNLIKACHVQQWTCDIIVVYCLGPPRITPLQPQFHAELGRDFEINCTATNVHDATINLNFTWSTPNGVQFDISSTAEDESRTATSTLHIDMITPNHGGEYQCIVSNGGEAIRTTSSEIVVQGKCHLIYHVTGLTTNHF